VALCVQFHEKVIKYFEKFEFNLVSPACHSFGTYVLAHVFSIYTNKPPDDNTKYVTSLNN